MATLTAIRSTCSRSSLLRRLAVSSPGISSQPLRRGPQCWFSSYPPHEVMGLPALSPTMESGSISSWNKEVGEAFGAGDVLCSVETDKATVDFEAQDDGIVAKLLVDAGPDEIPVGHPIIVIVESEDDVAAFADFQVSAEAAASPATSAEPAAPPPPVAATTPPPAAPVAAPASAASADHVFASPLARMLAKEMGHNVASIPGTGPEGRVLAADVREYLPSASDAVVTGADAAATPAPAAMAGPPVVGAGFVDYPLPEAAREVAARLQQSKRNVPHYYLTVDISVDALLSLRATLNESMASKDDDEGLGVYEMLLKAAAASMKTVPAVNASWMESHVRVYDSVDVNVVLGAGDSLHTPVLTGVDTKGLGAISKELKKFVAQGLPDENSEEVPVVSNGVGTFTVMNLGMYGISSCAPIIREPQSCALAVGALESRIVPNDVAESEEIYKESIMITATLSCDHRVVDGAVGAQWLAAFKSHVENPSTLLL